MNFRRMRPLVSTFAATLLILLSSAAAQAQLAVYEFTGGVSNGPGASNIEGTVVVDLGAPPTHEHDQSGEKIAEWEDGNFSIDFLTYTVTVDDPFLVDIVNGTSVSGDAYFRISDGGHYKSIQISSYDAGSDIEIRVSATQTPGDGTTSIPHPFDLTTWGVPQIKVLEWGVVDDRGKIRNTAYTISSWELVDFIPLTIVIGDADTGIEDLEYEGVLVSELIAEAAVDAKNHGKFVSSVAKLTNDLKKAGLLTDEEKEILTEAAAESSIGR